LAANYTLEDLIDLDQRARCAARLAMKELAQ